MFSTIAYFIAPGDVSLPAFTDLNSIITKVLPVIISLSGLAAFAFLIMGGIKYISAGGDDKALGDAKKTITNALIGLLIVFVAFWIIRILETVLGLNITGFNQ